MPVRLPAVGRGCGCRRPLRLVRSSRRVSEDCRCRRACRDDGRGCRLHASRSMDEAAVFFYEPGGLTSPREEAHHHLSRRHATVKCVRSEDLPPAVRPQPNSERPGNSREPHCQREQAHNRRVAHMIAPDAQRRKLLHWPISPTNCRQNWALWRYRKGLPGLKIPCIGSLPKRLRSRYQSTA